MSLTPTPTDPIDWATVLQNNSPLGGANRINPSLARQQTGWLWGDKPDYETFNGWMYNVSQYINWAVENLEDLDVTVDGLATADGVNENNLSTILLPAGSSLAFSGNQVGVLVVALPNSWTNTRLRFYVDIFEEDPGISTSILVSGYNLSATTEWTDTQASIVTGDATLRVRFGHDGSNCCIIIGETTTTWRSLHTRVRNFTAHGGASWQFANWTTGWASSIAPDLTGITTTGGDLEPAASVPIKVAIYQDVKATTVVGGSSVGGWQTRTLNTEVSDVHGLATLAANAVTPIAGVYLVRAKAPARLARESRIALHDGTSRILYGSSSMPDASVSAIIYCELEGIITADGVKSYSIQHFITDAWPTTGLGVAVSDGSNEIYSQLTLTRIGDV